MDGGTSWHHSFHSGVECLEGAPNKFGGHYALGDGGGGEVRNAVKTKNTGVSRPQAKYVGAPPGHHSGGHLAWQCKPGEPGIEECRAIWQYQNTLDEVAQQLCNTRLRPLTVSAIGTVEQRAVAITQAPSVWAMLEDALAPGALQWLLDTFLFGKLASLKLLQTGEAIPLEQEEPQPASIRLETLLEVTKQRRSKWIQKTNDILSEEILKSILDEWKADYKAWMNQSSQDEWHRTKYAKRHDFERKRFRNFLFKMCGCYELVIFWLRVPANWISLRIFWDAFNEERIGVVNRAVEAVRDVNESCGL